MWNDELDRTVLKGIQPDPDLHRHVPRALRHEVGRPGLLARIREAHEARLVVLAAPSGYGKTALLAQYVRSDLVRRPNRPVVWLTLGHDDADPETLARSVSQAVMASVPALTAKRLRGPPRSAKALAADLNGAEASLTLVLDRTDRLGVDAAVWLETLVDSLAEGHQLLLSGYEVPLDLARLAAGEVAVVLGPAELAFGQVEAEAYLGTRGYAGDPVAAWRTLEGWPVGLSLVAAGASPGPAPADLVHELLGRLAGDLRRGLGEASVLERWSEAHASALGLDLPTGWLRAARRAGLGLTPLTAGVYSPHRLLRQVLEDELLARPERHHELRRRAAAHAEATGAPLKALTHYRKAGLDDRVVQLALELVPRFEQRREYGLVRQVLETAQPDRLPPVLLRFLGTALCQTGEAGRGEVTLRELRASGWNDVPTLLTLGELAHRRGLFGEALARFGEAMALTTDAGEQADVACAQAATLCALGRFEQAGQVARRTSNWAERTDDLRRLARALPLLAEAEHGLGQHQETILHLERALSLHLALHVPIGAVETRIALAGAYLAQGECSRALDQLERAQAAAEPSMGGWRPLLTAARSEIHFWRGAYKEAATGYREAIAQNEEDGPGPGTFLSWTRLIEATRRAGDVRGADVALQRARTLKLTVASPRHLTALAFQEGVMAFCAGACEAASVHFSEAEADQSVQGVRATLYLAEIARREQRLERKAVAEVVRRLDALGSDQLLRLDAALLKGLYTEVAGRGWWPERFSRFVSPSPEAAVRLEIRTLGRTEVRVGGRPAHLPFARCGELLAWLALHGPAPRDRIVDALWDGERGHLEYFRVVVRKLRAALSEPDHGFNPLPYEGGSYRLSARYELQLDAAEFETALGSRDPTRMRSVLDTCQGEFLPAAESEWVRSRRARVLDAALSVALALGNALEAHDSAGALTAYGRAAELDPLAEGAHDGLARIYMKLGDQASADHVQRAYARILSDGLGPARPPDFGER